MKDFRDECSMLVLEGKKNRIVDVLMMSLSEDVDRNLTHKKNSGCCGHTPPYSAIWSSYWL
jgi:hypothetical protein